MHNLLKIGQLAEHATDKKQIDKSLVAATRCLEDARQKSISCETRLDAAEYLRDHLNGWLAENNPILPDK